MTTWLFENCEKLGIGDFFGGKNIIFMEIILVHMEL